MSTDSMSMSEPKNGGGGGNRKKTYSADKESLKWKRSIQSQAKHARVDYLFIANVVQYVCKYEAQTH